MKLKFCFFLFLFGNEYTPGFRLGILIWHCTKGRYIQERKNRECGKREIHGVGGREGGIRFERCGEGDSRS